MVEYATITEKQWSKIPAPSDARTLKQQRAQKWEPLLRDLAQGKIVSLKIQDDKELRSLRMTIARRASQNGLGKTEARWDENTLMIKLLSE